MQNVQKHIGTSRNRQEWKATGSSGQNTKELTEHAGTYRTCRNVQALAEACRNGTPQAATDRNAKELTECVEHAETIRN